MSDTYAAKLGRIADEMDARGEGVEGWEQSDLHRWAEGIRQVRDAAESDPYAGTPCGGHLGAVARYIAMLEAMGRKHKAELEALRAERDALRNELARLEGQTHSFPTEEELSPEMRARLMPEGMEWPRFEDGEPVRIGDDFRAPTMSGSTESVLGVEFAENVWNGGGYQVIIWPDNRDDHLEENMHYALDPGERVKRPKRKVFPKDAPEDGPSGKNPPILSDSWERLGHDIECYGIGYASTLPDEADRERDALVARAKALAAGPDVVRPGEVV